MVLLAGCASSGPTDDVSAELTTPAPFAGLKTNDWNVYAPTAALPGVFQDTGAHLVDPAFGTTVKRIGVSAATKSANSAITSIMPFYAKEQAWSSDMAYLVTWSNDGSVELFDGGRGLNGHAPYALIRLLPEGGGPGFKGCYTDNEVRWSTDPATPQKMFHVCGTKFYSYDAASNTDTLLVDWNTRLPGRGYTYVTSDAEGNPSSIRDAASGMYNRYWAFDARDSSGATKDVLVYDRYADKVLAQVAGSTINTCPGGSSGIDWLGMSPSGKYVVIVVGNTSVSQTSHIGCGVGVYSPQTLAFERQVMPTDWHGDVGLDAAGNEVFVGMYEPTTAYTPTSGAAEISSVRLSDGARTRMQLWGNDASGKLQSMYGSTNVGFHVSMRATVDPTHGLPGYALLSWYNGTSSTASQYAGALFGNGEQNALYVPGDGSVAQAKLWRISQTRSYRVGYNDEPHCVPSPDFTRTLCGSNWGNTSAEMPVYPLVTELGAAAAPPPPPPSSPPDMASPPSHPSDMASPPSHPSDMASPPSHPSDMASPPSSPSPAGGFSVKPASAAAAPYATVSTTFTAPAGEASDDFVGIFASGASNWSWQYAHSTGGATTGTLPLVAPGAAGKYEVRYIIKSSWTAKATAPLCVGSGC